MAETEENPVKAARLVTRDLADEATDCAKAKKLTAGDHLANAAHQGRAEEGESRDALVWL